MAYNSANLSALGYSNGFTLWHYRTEEKVLFGSSPDGYFSPAHRMLRVGDMILCNYGVNTDEPGHCILVVTSNKDQKVEVHGLCGMVRDPTDGEYNENHVK